MEDDRRVDFEITMQSIEMGVKRINAFFTQDINEEDMLRLKALSTQLNQLMHQKHCEKKYTC